MDSLDSSLKEGNILKMRIRDCGKYLPWSTHERLCKWFLSGYWSRRSISAPTNYKAWWGKWPPSSAEVRASYWYPLPGWCPERWYRASCSRRTPFSWRADPPPRSAILPHLLTSSFAWSPRSLSLRHERINYLNDEFLGNCQLIHYNIYRGRTSFWATM